MVACRENTGYFGYDFEIPFTKHGQELEIMEQPVYWKGDVYLRNLHTNPELVYRLLKADTTMLCNIKGESVDLTNFFYKHILYKYINQTTNSKKAGINSKDEDKCNTFMTQPFSDLLELMMPNEIEEYIRSRLSTLSQKYSNPAVVRLLIQMPHASLDLVQQLLEIGMPVLSSALKKRDARPRLHTKTITYKPSVMSQFLGVWCLLNIQHFRRLFLFPLVLWTLSVYILYGTCAPMVLRTDFNALRNSPVVWDDTNL